MMRRVCCVWVAGIISLYGGGVAAMIPDWPEAGWIWSDEWMSDLSGVRLFQREVSAPSTPAEVARILARRFPDLNRLMVLEDRILLSGLSKAYHWLATVERDASGARAMISAMAVRGADDRAGGFDPAPYAPADARLKFSHAQSQDGYTSTQLLYESGQSMPALALRVRRALSRGGWRMQGGVAGEGSRQLWLRAGERLHVRLHGRAPGSVLWLLHEGAASR